MSNRRRFLKNASLITGAISLGSFPQKLLASDDVVRLTILHTNDIHCHIDPFPKNHPRFPEKGGMARLGGYINQARAENPNLLLLNAGDMFQGTPYFNFYKGELMIKVMNTLGYDASTIGNHEFDIQLEGFNNALQYAKFPMISSNYDFSKTILNNQTYPYKVFDKEGIKIGIYGLGIELNGLVKPEDCGETQYLDPVKVSKETESVLKNKHHCNLIICLSHLGYSYDDDQVSDLVIAKKTKYTDLIIGGHTHTFLEKPVEVENAVGKNVIVNQAGWGGLAIGRIEFLFNRNGKKRILGTSLIHVL